MKFDKWLVWLASGAAAAVVAGSAWAQAKPEKTDAASGVKPAQTSTASKDSRANQDAKLKSDAKAKADAKKTRPASKTGDEDEEEEDRRP